MTNLLKRKRENIKNLISAIILLIDRMDRHHIFLIAAGIAFNILIYIIPLILVAVYIVDAVWGIDNLTVTIADFAKDILPPSKSTNIVLSDILNEVNLIFEKSSIFGWVGIISLIWISSALFSSLRAGLNRIFHVASSKTFILYKVKDILFSILFAVLIFFSSVLLSSYALPVMSIIESFVHENLPSFLDVLLSRAVLIGMSLFTSFVLFYLLYRFVPNKRQPSFIINVSTLICVILIEISRNLFAMYVAGFGTYGKFYGTYAVLVAMAFWIYYLILIVLISAEIGRFIYEVKKLH